MHVPGALSYELPMGFLDRHPPNCLKSCSILSFASDLRGLSTHLTDGETEACGYKSNCRRGLGPRLRTQSSFSPAQGFPTGFHCGSRLRAQSPGSPFLYQLFSCLGNRGWTGSHSAHNKQRLYHAHVI